MVEPLFCCDIAAKGLPSVFLACEALNRTLFGDAIAPDVGVVFALLVVLLALEGRLPPVAVLPKSGFAPLGVDDAPPNGVLLVVAPNRLPVLPPLLVFVVLKRLPDDGAEVEEELAPPSPKLKVGFFWSAILTAIVHVPTIGQGMLLLSSKECWRRAVKRGLRSWQKSGGSDASEKSI